MTRKCWKKVAGLTWAFLECMFFSSVVLGWTWLAIVLRSDAYFPEYCNLTLLNVSSKMSSSAKLESVTGMLKLGSEGKQPTNKRNRPCRPSRSLERSKHPSDMFESLGLTSVQDTSIDAGGELTTHEVVSLQERTITASSVAQIQNIMSLQDMTTTTAGISLNSEVLSLQGMGSASEITPPIPKVIFVGDGAFTAVDSIAIPGVIPTRDRATSQRKDALTKGAITLPEGEILMRDIFVEGEWTHSIMAQSQQRYKRGDSAISVSQAASTDAMTDVVDRTFSLHVDGYCLEQNEQLRLMFSLVIIIRDVLTFPLGVFYDKYGTTRTRLLTVLIFALGTLMMTFTSSSVPWLVVPALTLTGVAGSAVLLTNLQTANLFGRKRHVVLSLYVGAAYSNGIITYLMQLSHFNGVDVQTSFMFLTIGIVPMLVSTVAFLPKTRVPWPLPVDYGKRRNQSLDETMLRKQRAWQRRMSEAGVIICRKPPPKFSPTAVQSLFVWSVLWFGIQKLHEAVFETRIVGIANMEVMGPLDFQAFFGFVQLLGAFCSPLVGVLIDRHLPRELGITQATRQMQRIVPAIVATSCLALSEIVIDMFTGPAPQAISTLFNILHKVFTQTTMCAFVMHVHYNHHHLGKFYGLTCAVSAITAAFQFPVRTFLVKKYSSMLPAHVLLIILSIISFAHAINAWNHCRKRLIRDQSDRSSERCTRTTPGHAPVSVHIETDDSNLPGNKSIGGDDIELRVGCGEDGPKLTSPDDDGAIEMSDVSTHVDGRNGGFHAILETPLGWESEKDDNTPFDDEDEEESIIATALEFIKI